MIFLGIDKRLYRLFFRIDKINADPLLLEIFFDKSLNFYTFVALNKTIF